MSPFAPVLTCSPGDMGGVLFGDAPASASIVIELASCELAPAEEPRVDDTEPIVSTVSTDEVSEDAPPAPALDMPPPPLPPPPPPVLLVEAAIGAAFSGGSAAAAWRDDAPQPMGCPLRIGRLTLQEAALVMTSVVTAGNAFS